MSNPLSRRSLRFSLTVTISIAVFVGVFWGSLISLADKNSEFAAALVPLISATKVDAIFTDADGDGRADPGDTLQYTVTINNTGPDPATSAIFTDTLPNTLTLVPGSVNASPIGFDDSYTATGNVRITVAAGSGVLANDIDPNTGNNIGLTASAGLTSANGGNVTMNPDGGFVYNPPAGFQGTDTFTYTVTDPGGATGTGTVTFNVSGMIWFVNASAPGGGDGRLSAPFNCLVGAGCFDPVAADGAGDNIFLFSGSYTGGLTLLANQRLIGQGASAALSAITGLTPPSGSDALPATGGARPAVTTAGASTNGVNVGSGNTLRGFNIGNTTAVDISGTGIGTLTIADMDLTGTGRLLNLTTGSLAATFGSLATTSAPGGAGVSLTSIGGSLTVSVSTTVSGAGTQGISISGSSLAANFGSTTVGSTTQGILVGTSTGNISFGNTAITAGTDGISLQNNSAGTRSFGTLSTTNGSGVGFLHGVGGGAATISGQATLTNPGGRCIDIQNSTTAVTFANVNATQCGGTGVFLNANSGAVSFAGLDISPDAGQRPLHATSNTGVITSTSGTIPASGTAVSVEIVGTSAAIRTPLNVQLTSVSASGGGNGIILRNTTSSGSPGGFVVNGDGTNTTVGGNSTGGTVTNMTGADGAIAGNGVYLENATGVTLRRMTLNGTNQNHGIRGINSSNFTMEFSTVTGTNGTSAALDEGSVNFDNLTGAAAITSCSIDGGFEDNLNVVNTSGTLNRLVITGTTFGFNNTTNGNNNILIESQNAGTTLNFTLQSSIIKGARADWLNASNNSNSVMDAVIGGSTSPLGNTFDNLTAGFVHPGAAAGGNRVVFGAVGVQTVDIRNNTMKGSKGEAIRVRSTATGALTGAVHARVRDNTIGVAGIPNSGSSEGSGIFAFVDGGGDANVAITNNSVFQYNNHGIRIDVGDEINDGTVVNATVTGNTVNSPGNINSEFNGFHLNHGTVAATDNFTSCIDVGGAGGLANNLVGSGNGVTPPNNQQFRLRQRQATTVRLPGYGGANNNDAAVVTFLQGRNTVTVGNGAASNTVPTGGGFVGGATCTQPSVPAFSERTANENPRGRDNNNLSFLVMFFDRQPTILTDLASLESQIAKAKLLDAMASAEAGVRTAEVISDIRNTPISDDPSTVVAFLARLVDMISPTAYSQELKGDEGTKPDTKEPESGETITVNGSGTGFVIPPGKSTTITFRAVIGNALPAATTVSNQGSVSGNFTTVLTDDPDIAGPANPTVTNIDHTTVAVASNINPSVFGQNVTFTATMTGVPSRVSDPPGTVQFKADNVNIGAAVPVVVGTLNDNVSTAQASISTLAVGTRVITAEYSGGGSGATGYNANIGTLSGGQAVGVSNTTTSLTSSQNPAPQGTTITFTATISVTAPGGGAPSGTVQFRDGATPITGCTAVTVSANSAACMTNALTPGNHTISAVYSGDTSFNTSTGNLTGNPQVITGPPVVTPTAGLTRIQGNPASNSVIAMVSDDVSVPGAVNVVAQTVPTGMQVTNIVNTNGSISADVRALCNAATGNNTIVLRATDGKGLTQDANLVINVQANPSPTLGNYANQTVVTSCKLVIRPDAVPSDNQPLASVTATSPTFTGTLSVDPATGFVTASNSGPIAGSPHTITVTATDSCGLTSVKNFTISVTAAPTAAADFDFDGDRKADIAVYRAGATSADQSFWFVLRSSDLTVQAPQFGVGGDRVVTADYDGDGTANFAVFRPSTGVWYTSLNAGTNYDAFPWGTTGDIPVPGRYDADNKADHAVFRPSTGQWWIFRSTGGSLVRNWGVSTDLPVPADYDGDGITDLAVYRPSTLSFHILRSTGGVLVQPFGAAGDKLVPADYDGDGKDDVAVWRPSTGFWFVIQSGNGLIRQEQWGLNGDVPVPADYDNDGKADFAVFRPSDGHWWIFSSCPCVTVGLQWGIATDKPVPSAFIP